MFAEPEDRRALITESRKCLPRKIRHLSDAMQDEATEVFPDSLPILGRMVLTDSSVSVVPLRVWQDPGGCKAFQFLNRSFQNL